MRIISGTCRGRRLAPVKGLDIRPTSDRTREAVFNILGPKIRDAHILDLFAGTGALGIEALSRGAGRAVFVDIDCCLVRRNLELCRLTDAATLIEGDLSRKNCLSRILGQHFDVIFMDPPYRKGYIDMLLEDDALAGLLDENGVIVAEHALKEKISIAYPGLDISRQKKYSKTIISLINRI